MPKPRDPGPMGRVELKLPLLGRAIGEAIEKVTEDRGDRFVFALFVIDSHGQKIAWTTNGEKESLYAALSEFLSRQSH